MQTFSLCFVIVLALAAVAAAHSATPAAHVAVTREKLHDDRMQGMLKFVDDMMHSSFRIRHDPSVEESATFECAMCVVALNEVSGLLAENRTETEIMDFVDKDICSHLGGDVGKACEALIADLPEVIGNIDGYFEPNVACSKDLHMCAAAPFEHEHSVVFDIPTYVVDLDLPANQRWSQLCSNETFKAEWQQMTTWIKAGLSDGGKYIEEFGQLINHMIGGDYGEEIQGCATELGVGYGWVTFVNIGFEASAFCTSIVAETEDGTILHARNLDFPAGSGFTNTLRNISVIADFQTGGKTVYKTTTFAGFVGALSGQVPGGWSITINTRWNPNGLTGYFDMIVDGLEHKNFSMVTILARETLATIPDWTGAVKHLSDYPILAPVYYTVAGVGSGEGAIITRNMTEAVNVWTLDAAAGRWFELETNYDHWKPAPWFDDRRDPGNAHMKEIGQAGLTLDKMFTDVLSVKPTLNLETTYSFLSIPANGTYKSYGHICGEEDGCVQ